VNIAIVGTGYVGLVAGACFADFGHTVMCVDVDARRLDEIRAGRMPFYEPGLSEIVQRGMAAGRLRFTTDAGEAVRGSLVLFITVGTPDKEDGSGADLSQIEAAVQALASHIEDYRVVVLKSTVPVGTSQRIRSLLSKTLSPGSFDVVSNPEFLREGSAIGDFVRPDRVVIGASSPSAAAIMREIYRPLYLIEAPIIVTDNATAEMIKYASNAFLAMKVSFINEVANLCDNASADVHVVAKGMGLDRRIGPKFLHPGPGYGGSCFPKDTRALAAIGRQFGAPQRLVEATIAVNEHQRDVVFQKIERALEGVKGREIAILGLSFKPNTSDVRESPALDICERLIAAGAHLRLFDPVAADEAVRELARLSGTISTHSDAYVAATGADAVVIMTEWNEFRNLDLKQLMVVMRSPMVIDIRNVLEPAQAQALGIPYVCMGRPVAVPTRA
jgi:UDPglucose 6-dehydrogenase